MHERNTNIKMYANEYTISFLTGEMCEHCYFTFDAEIQLKDFVADLYKPNFCKTLDFFLVEYTCGIHLAMTLQNATCASRQHNK